MLDFRTINSKLLLFGEYSVIKNSKALAVTYSTFSGKLSFDHKHYDRNSNKELNSFKNYLTKIDAEKYLNLKDFEFDLKQGVYFDSNIPQGYGLGSSGVVTAAIFDRYSKMDKGNLDPHNLIKVFAKMESYFHGASSGFDPLTSFLNSPLLMNENKQISKVSIPENNQGHVTIFLLDSGKSRRTEPLINLFKEKLKNEYFEKFCLNDLNQVTANCIDNFLTNNIENLKENFTLLSKYQLDYFTPMIPALLLDDWKNSFDDNYYWFKLCGAGGGGFSLGLTTDFEKFSKKFDQKDVKVLMRL